MKVYVAQKLTLENRPIKCYTSVSLKRRSLVPTAKKRINLAVDDSLYEELEKLKELKKAPSLSSVVLELAREALELQEDLYFDRIASERESENTLSHEDVWKK